MTSLGKMGIFVRMTRAIELLSPASSLEGGRVALSAGADAVYIGAPKFGARSSAGVSLEDIGTLCYEAHSVGAKVYVALNTILTDSQLEEAMALAGELYRVGADALIVQDMGLLMSEGMPPIPLHSSTQCHNASHEQLALMEALGMEQVVLARELSSAELPELLEGLSIRVESFIHGALCVSYSGRCFISEACRGRSANRGACAQYCRMSYDLEDAEGHRLLESQYLLSLKDLNRTEILEEMLDGGVSSLKIEGRLKGIDYVRNVTAHYREQLDAIIARRGEAYHRASWGRVERLFTPHPERTFSRRFTSYNIPLHRPIPVDSITPFTNKSVGERIGQLLECRGREMVIKVEVKDPELSNGDGLLLVSSDEKETAGAFINQVTSLGKGRYRLKLSSPLTIASGATVYRNLHHQLDQVLQRPDASVRKVGIRIDCHCSKEGVQLSATLLERPEISARVERLLPLEPAKKDNSQYLRNTLAKLGETPYVAEEISLYLEGLYLPPSVATELRREVIQQLQEACHATFLREREEQGRALADRRATFLATQHQASEWGLPESLDFTYNVANQKAEQLYRQLGVTGTIAPALEVAVPEGPIPVMFTRHCLLHQVGYCTREGKRPPFALPLYLVRGKERFRVSTNCRECMMTLWKD
ncbi:U32 family peptidase [uncultured Porphyromonas sp.]|uniref:peptidase U32 family protein n=1 Tax=uncultured Porphyromonas sp. TaxID=159274 RepID=UPI00260541C4|nr:U32 family peptidase [uncultured Porphyromonas sp.]